MAKARAIVKRRKAVRNIRKITKTMQMIATAKYQKALKRAVGTKPYTMKVREFARDLAVSVEKLEHPLLRQPSPEDRSGRIALLVITSARGLCGGYNANVLRAARTFIEEQESAGNHVDLYVSGKKGVSFFTFRKRTIEGKFDQPADMPKFTEVEKAAELMMNRFIRAELDGFYIAYMNFISAGVQRPELLKLLPLPSLQDVIDQLIQQAAEKDAQAAAGALDMRRSGEIRTASEAAAPPFVQTMYDYSPDAQALLAELLPGAVKARFYQAYLDAVTSEHIARMVAMKSATDNADKMVKALTMKYNRARQSQITTELSEIMGGVEAMKS
jgi:F-type H+-transporting ATPase subunit gamma